METFGLQLVALFRRVESFWRWNLAGESKSLGLQLPVLFLASWGHMNWGISLLPVC